MKKLLLLGALLVGTSPVWALSYEIGNGSVSANKTDPGLVISTSVFGNVAGMDFNLNDGQSYTFNFFKIWTNEGSVNSDDTAPKAISAQLDFLNPVASAVIGGSTQGVAATLFGWFEYGKVTWNSIAPIIAGDRVFSVKLSNEVFNKGLWDLDSGYCDGAIVKATITQHRSQVPDGGVTLALLGVTLLGLVAIRRKIA